MESQSLILFFLIALVLVGGAIVFSTLVAPKSFNLVKSEPYECGIPSEGPAWIQFNVGYYLFAIIYLIFDVETVFLFPWAVSLKEIGLVGFWSVMVFLGILVVGFIYEWKKGALDWE